MLSKRFLAAALIGTAALGISGKEQSKAEEPSLTLGEWLDVCSPLEAFDGSRTLTFVPLNKRLVLTEAVGDERAAGALKAKHPKVTQGRWYANEATREITVDFDSGPARERYILVIPFGEDQCILAAGAPASVDMRASWFSVPDFNTAEER